MNGHGGNRDAVDRAVADARRRGSATCCPGGRDVAGGDAHAGRTETSLVLALAPSSCGRDRAEAGATAPLAELAPACGPRASGPSAPTASSATRPAPARRRAATCSTRSPTSSSPPSTLAPRSGPPDDDGTTLDASTRRPAAHRRRDRRFPAAAVPADPRRGRRLRADRRRRRTSRVASERLVDRLLDAGAIHPQPECRRR